MGGVQETQLVASAIRALKPAPADGGSVIVVCAASPRALRRHGEVGVSRSHAREAPFADRTALRGDPALGILRRS
jgi:hypothetical protein